MDSETAEYVKGRQLEWCLLGVEVETGDIGQGYKVVVMWGEVSLRSSAWHGTYLIVLCGILATC